MQTLNTWKLHSNILVLYDPGIEKQFTQVMSSEICRHTAAESYSRIRSLYHRLYHFNHLYETTENIFINYKENQFMQIISDFHILNRKKSH